jgi:hypothetical protein
MLTVTEVAKVFLAELIQLRGFSGETAIRLFYGGRKLAMVGDGKRKGDVAFQHEGRTILLMGGHVSDLLADRFLVVDGSELKLRENNDEV